MAAAEPELVKMSVFAKRAGLPVPTIKHYLREGLLPEPVRTSKNMAYYDVALIPRVQTIKALQKRFFLPLKLIREVLDEVGDDVPAEDITVRSEARVIVECDDVHLGAEDGPRVARIGDRVQVGSGSSAGLWPIVEGSAKVRCAGAATGEG